MGTGPKHVTLVQNPSAGGGRAKHSRVGEALLERGHTVREVNPDEALGKNLAAKSDVVIAAGGDGTVLGVARRLVQTGVPLVIFPLGTANNLARSVGMPDDLELLLATLDDPWARDLDLGVATGSWGERYFCESAGVGWFSDALQTVSAQDKAPERALARLRELLGAYQARRWTVFIDAEDCSGPFISIDVMNARSFGPNLELGADADSFDGALDVVLLRPNDLARLDAYLQALGDDPAATPPKFPTRKAKHVHLVLERERVRIDDAVRPKPDAPRSHFVDLRVLAGAVRLWLPKSPEPT